MRFHVPSLPHTEVTRAFDWCAYTAKARRFCDMMTSRGHDVFLYAGEECEANVTEHVVTKTEKQRCEWALLWDEVPADKAWATGAPWWEHCNLVTAAEIRRRMEPGDFLCCIGTSHEPIGRMLPELITVEHGIGYYGTFAEYRAYESYSHMHHCMGTKGEHHGRFLDAVIPNAYHCDELATSVRRAAGGYLLYMGRLTESKGVRVAADVAEASGLRLLCAGAGDRSLAPNAGYAGVVTGDAKAQIIRGAVAVLVPSLYIEPFGGIAVEAMLTGTPAITTDWGAFTETVPEVYRCRDLNEFVGAVKYAADDDGEDLRVYARERFSTAVVGDQYERWFSRIGEAHDGDR